jgi:hypothetical protein
LVFGCGRKEEIWDNEEEEEEEEEEEGGTNQMYVEDGADGCEGEVGRLHVWLCLRVSVSRHL